MGRLPGFILRVEPTYPGGSPSRTGRRGGALTAQCGLDTIAPDHLLPHQPSCPMSLLLKIAVPSLALLALCSSCLGPQAAEPDQQPISADALTGEWAISTFQGAPLLDGSAAFLGFDADGRVYGNTGVNQVMGTWSLDGGAFEIGPLGSTRMAGPEPLMAQERELLVALSQVNFAGLGEDGQLFLGTPENTSLIAASPKAN